MAVLSDGILKGACDNVAGVLACAQLAQDDIIVEFTYDEEVTMDGAKLVARKEDPASTLFIAVDVTKKMRSWPDRIKFTVENINGIHIKHVRRALKKLKGQYRVHVNGDESEAWLYRDLGFITLEIDVPCAGGLHSLDAVSRVEDIVAASMALRYLAEYFKDLSREELGAPPQ